MLITSFAMGLVTSIALSALAFYLRSL